jgi:hypothetical protein
MLKDRKKQKDNEKPGRTQFIMMFFAFAFGMILSNLLAQSSAQRVEDEAPPLFIYKGIDKRLDDISPEFRTRIMELDDERRRALELAAIQLHVYQYAKDKNITPQQAGEELFPASQRAVDEAQINQFFNENRDELAKPFYQVKNEIKSRLEYQNVAKLKKDLLVSLEESGDLAILPVR